MATPTGKIDFPAYFMAKGISPKCESCGHNEWAPLDGAAVLPAQRTRVPFVEHRLPVYVLGCVNCGFVRLYIKEAVDEWLKETTAT